MNELSLVIRGTAHEGWESVRVTRSIQQVHHTFAVSYSERATASGRRVPIFGGDPCTVKIDGKIVTKGWVAKPRRAYDAQSRSAVIQGASLTIDLVECAAEHKGGQWRNAGLMDIAKALCAPFKVPVIAETSVGARFRKFAIQDGETVIEALDRAARMRGVLLTTAPNGSLVFTRAGSARSSTVLRYGVNILSGEFNEDTSGRFSKYVVKTQATGDDDFSGEQAASLSRQAEDKGVARYRPTVILAENEDSGKELQDRAVWERNVRAGRSRTLSYTVENWHDDDGNLWSPNTLVRVDDEELGIRDELLIVTTEQSKDEQSGTITNLELMRREAFDLIEFPPKKPKGSGLLDDSD